MIVVEFDFCLQMFLEPQNIKQAYSVKKKLWASRGFS